MCREIYRCLEGKYIGESEIGKLEFILAVDFLAELKRELRGEDNELAKVTRLKQVK